MIGMRPLAPVECADGTVFDVGRPTPESLPATWAIGQALSRINRFLGHTIRPVNVANHSLRVALIVAGQGHDVRTILGALVHDAPEAFVADVPSPVKRLVGLDYVAVERRVGIAIAARYGLLLDDLECNAVRHADLLALHQEASLLLPSRGAGWGLPPLDEMPGPDRLDAAAEMLGFRLDAVHGHDPVADARLWSTAVEQLASEHTWRKRGA